MPSQNSTEFEASQVGKRRTLTNDEVIRMPRSSKVILDARERLMTNSTDDLVAMESRLVEITTTWSKPTQAQFDMLADVQAILKSRKTL